MKVYIPTPLRSYTAQKDEVDSDGPILDEVLLNVDRRYPGFRFRIIDEQNGIRQHIKIFINQEETRDLSTPVGSNDEIHIICALSGGASNSIAHLAS